MDNPIRHPLAYARKVNDLSQNELAHLLDRAARKRGLRSGADKTTISRYERWLQRPNRETQLLMADAEVFDVPVADVDRYGWPDWLPGSEIPLPLGSGYAVQVLRDAQKAAMDRRTFMTYSAAALAGLGAQWVSIDPDHLASALSGRTTADHELIDWLEDSSRKLTGLPTEQRQHTIKMMDAHLETVTDLIEGGRHTGTATTRLHSLAASLSTTCGWYRFDQGRHYAAGKLWTAALHSSHAAGDRDFGAGVLSDFAYQSNWLGQPNVSVDQLGHAITGTKHPTARSLLFLRRARAYAALGERSLCYRDLSAAETALSAQPVDVAPNWCSWMSAADLAVDSGQCLLDLGQLDDASAKMREGLSLLPKARDKTRGIFLTYQARGLLQSRHVEHALAVTQEALELAHRIGAERCVAQVRELAPAFKPYRKVTGVDDFIERLRAA
ncbi:helix-turn-helix transcriptional regulator [Streptomyces sp. NPDC052299]|uniref:helix-turn-helix transcriptional regulator n=1 Tax=Streptomyces sp. NPDC052299 TaxID=3155054 RepID=UPI003446BF0D